MDWAPYIRDVEGEMRDLLSAPDPAVAPFYGMLNYHLGWVDCDFQPAEASSGKRFRPVVCLLSCEAQGNGSAQAVPAAAGIELLHNFSLIHDDIEDNSPLRRHRETVWRLWGVPQAINAGDGMHVIAHLALLRLQDSGVPAEKVLRVTRILDDVCLRLCYGQYLDLAFEERLDIAVDEYRHMIGGKTAALLSASAQVGALLGTDDLQVVDAYRRYGFEMGLAFQMVDDILGVWGDPSVTGKSAASDILAKKKALPALYALARLDETNREHAATLRDIYGRDEVTEADVPVVLDLFDEAGARVYVQTAAEEHTERALSALRESGCHHPAQDELARAAADFLQRTY